MAGINVTIGNNSIDVSMTGPSASGGVTIHNNLTGRDATDSHPQSAITDLVTDLAGKQATSTLAATIRSTILTGVNLVTSQVIAATDTILAAFGYLQAQITLYRTETFAFALSDETTDITVASKIGHFVFPYAFTVTEIFATLTTAATGASFTINIKKNTVSVFTTKLTFDSGEFTTRTASVPYVLVTSPLVWASNDIMEILVDVVGATVAGKGCIIEIIGYKS